MQVLIKFLTVRNLITDSATACSKIPLFAPPVFILHSSFCLLPSLATPSGRATYQISHCETFENGPVSPAPQWPCAAPAIGERDRPGRTRRRLADGIPFVSFASVDVLPRSEAAARSAPGNSASFPSPFRHHLRPYRRS